MDTLLNKVNDFNLFRSKVQSWIDFHMSNQTIGIPQKFKRIVSEPLDKITSADFKEMACDTEPYSDSIEIINYFQKNKYFKEVCNNFRDELQKKQF